MISDHSTVGTAPLSPVRSKGVPIWSFRISRAKYKLQRCWWYYPTELQRLDFREESTTNCFPSIFQMESFFKLQTKREGKCLLHPRKKIPFYQVFFILVCMHCPKIKVRKYKLFKMQYNQYNLFPFPKLYCQYWGNLKRVKKQVKINNAVFKVKLL